MTKGREPTADERTAILLEEMRSNFKLVIEKVQDSDKKLQGIKQDIKETKLELKQDIYAVSKKVSSIEEQLPPMQFILREHDQRLKKVEGV